MDDYVTKPIRRDKLFSALVELVGQEGARPPAPAREEPVDAEILDRDELWERIDGDAEFFEHLRDLFRRDSAALQQRIREAIDGEDAESLTRAAHELKGMAANLAAPTAAEAARRLEFMGREETLDGASEACDELADALERLDRELADFTPP